MMVDLHIKARQEKYYNSIKYFYHTLPSDKKTEFIQIIAEQNIFLASQCALTGQEDIALELRLKNIALEKAKQFSNADQSAHGFLALAEFDCFEDILTLLSQVTAAKRIYSQVFHQILANADQIVFFKFLEICDKLKLPHLIQYAISSYNGNIRVDSINRQILKNIFNDFLANTHYGTLRVMLEKFSIADDYLYIMQSDIQTEVNRILNAKKYTAINLAYSIVTAYNAYDLFPKSFFIRKFTGAPGIKGILTAIRMVDEKDVNDIQRINKKLADLLSNGDEISNIKVTLKSIKLIKLFFKKGGSEYLEDHDYELYLKFQNVIRINQPNIKELLGKRERFTFLGTEVAESDNIEFQKIVADCDITILNSELSQPHDILSTIFLQYFKSKNSLSLELLISLLLSSFNISFQDINKAMRRFAFMGGVLEIRKYGVYIHCDTFLTTHPLFVPKNLFARKDAPNLSELKFAHDLKFRIMSIDFRKLSIQIAPISRLSSNMVMV